MSERDRLRRAFRELHEADDPQAPDYRALTAAPARRVRPRAVAGAAWAMAVAAAAAVVILVLRAPTPPGEDETLRLAASMTGWEAPTDFLLLTPGAEFLQSAPLLGTGTETLPGDATDLLQEGFNETEVFE